MSLGGEKWKLNMAIRLYKLNSFGKFIYVSMSKLDPKKVKWVDFQLRIFWRKLQSGTLSPLAPWTSTAPAAYSAQTARWKYFLNLWNVLNFFFFNSLSVAFSCASISRTTCLCIGQFIQINPINQIESRAPFMIYNLTCGVWWTLSFCLRENEEYLCNRRS